MNSNLMKELRIRGLILEILKSEKNEYLDASDLQARLYLFGYALLLEDLLPHLRYLKDRRYLAIEKKYGGEIILVSLTADGDNFVRGIGPEDDGVLIPRCGRPHGQ